MYRLKWLYAIWQTINLNFIFYVRLELLELMGEKNIQLN